MSEQPQLSKVDELFASGFFGKAALEASEFHWRSIMGALLRYRDAEGRPLGEEVSPSECREGVTMEYRDCPYSGSRFRHPSQMNVSSLHQFTHYWRQVMGGLATMRDTYLGTYFDNEHRDDERLNLIDMWSLSRLGIMLPAYLLRRRPGGFADGEIPPMVAIIYRMMLGVNNVSHVRLLMTFATDMVEQMHVLDSDKFYAFADRNDMFIGHDSVCAGSPAMIKEVLRAMETGEMIPDADRGPMVELADEGFFRYSNLLMGLNLSQYIFGAHTMCMLYGLLREEAAANQYPALVTALTQFKEYCRDLTSTLAQEIANAGSDLQQRMIGGLQTMLKQINAGHRKLFGHNLEDRAAHNQNWQPGPDAVAQVHGVLESQVPEMASKRLAEALVGYLVLERNHLHVFTDYQTRIDEVQGRTDEGERLSGDSMLEVFGPSLATFATTTLGLRFINRDDETRIQWSGGELCL